MTTFTVIVATRNRPGLFAEALASVHMQRGAVFDVVVVMDGSDPIHDPGYAPLLARAGGQVIRLAHTSRGHGHSYAINRGADAATGDYLCFLDDDDCWTDPDHLARAAASIAAADADLYFADQIDYANGQARPEGDIWIEGLRNDPSRLGPADARARDPCRRPC